MHHLHDLRRCYGRKSLRGRAINLAGELLVVCADIDTLLLDEEDVSLCELEVGLCVAREGASGSVGFSEGGESLDTGKVSLSGFGRDGYGRRRRTVEPGNGPTLGVLVLGSSDLR